MVDLSSFNVLPSNSASVNGTQLLYAISQATAGGFSLHVDEGLYEIDGGIIEIGWQKFALIAKGPRVTFRQRTTLSGVSNARRFFSVNGSVNAPFPGSDGVKQIVFGGPHQINLRGNPNGSTGDLLYINKCHDSSFSFRARDATILCRLDAVGNPQNVAGVLNRIDMTSSPDWDEEAFAVPSVYGLLATNVYASEFRLNIEGAGGASGGQQAAYFDQSGRNWLKGGSLESNIKGGLFLTSTCRGFMVDSMDIEANGSAPDVTCHGKHNVFRNCSMYTAGQRTLVTGDYNSFEDCDIHGVVVNSNNTGIRNRFIGCGYMTGNGGFSDSGSGTIVRWCEGVSDQG